MPLALSFHVYYSSFDTIACPEFDVQASKGRNKCNKISLTVTIFWINVILNSDITIVRAFNYKMYFIFNFVFTEEAKYFISRQLWLTLVTVSSSFNFPNSSNGSITRIQSPVLSSITSIQGSPEHPSAQELTVPLVFFKDISGTRMEAVAGVTGQEWCGTVGWHSRAGWCRIR